MEKFKTIKSTVVPVQMDNIDTDQIIPARFLKATTRADFGKNLFRDLRYDEKDKPRENFVLNNPAYKGKILVAGDNFGCGSSREHAVWAIYDHGFRVVISSYFADIFKNNALNNGLLPVQVSKSFLDTIFENVNENSNTELIVDLENQSVKIAGTILHELFVINQFNKICFLNGCDDIDYLLSLKDTIEVYEKNSLYLQFQEEVEVNKLCS
ncbi:MAG: 3-isopropylmalate dehydratase small subunit [Bacteroidales bacterium]|nr:3-isopropylmalate dehydratase small subunit [Bacteroidales bacterium]